MNLTIVVVLYNQKAEESNTFKSLKQTLFPLTNHNHKLKIILYDNSSEEQDFNASNYKVDISYVHDQRNLGIATAYNYALSLATENNSEWLLLFDHDTEITPEYIDNILNLQKPNQSIVAIVPRINSANTMISPVYANKTRMLSGKKPKNGIQKDPVMAINSGTLIKVKFLIEIGGFNTDFPLDYLDHWLFHTIYEKGYMVKLLGVSLEHELSVMDYSGVSLARYKSILDSEMKFHKNYKKNMYREYKKQLALRFVKQLLTVKNKKIALYTLSRLFSK